MTSRLLWSLAMVAWGSTHHAVQVLAQPPSISDVANGWQAYLEKFECVSNATQRANAQGTGKMQGVPTEDFHLTIARSGVSFSVFAECHRDGVFMSQAFVHNPDYSFLLIKNTQDGEWALDEVMLTDPRDHHIPDRIELSAALCVCRFPLVADGHLLPDMFSNPHFKVISIAQDDTVAGAKSDDWRISFQMQEVQPIPTTPRGLVIKLQSGELVVDRAHYFLPKSMSAQYIRDSGKVEVRWSDFQEYDGLPIPLHMETDYFLKDDLVKTSSETWTIDATNASLPEDTFRLPAFGLADILESPGTRARSQISSGIWFGLIAILLIIFGVLVRRSRKSRAIAT